MDDQIILIRYGELSLKSEYVRNQFERTLIKNISNALKDADVEFTIKKERGRIFLITNKPNLSKNILKKIFGIVSFSVAIKTDSNIDKISDHAINISKKYLSENVSFALRVTRVGTHDFTSKQVAEIIGSKIVNKIKAPVNLSNPDFELFIEIRNKHTYLFTEKVRGVGGLPLGTQGRILTLIEDSKSLLASWFLMKRGCDAIFVILDNYDINVVKDFIKKWYLTTDVIKIDSKSKDIYTQLNKIIEKNNCDGMITGNYLKDNKQLLKLKKYSRKIKVPLLNPLVAMNENEIIKKCKKIGLEI